jgi:Trypsin-like peptidase domain
LNTKTEPLQILFTRFEANGANRPSISHIGPLPLIRDKNVATGIHVVEDQIFHLQPSFISTTHSALGQSVVPIVAMVGGESVIRCLGTGFFISANGLLLTAAHVITDPIERSYGSVVQQDELRWAIGNMKIGVMIATNPIFGQKGWNFYEIEWAEFLAEHSEMPLPWMKRELRLKSDIAICKVQERPPGQLHQPLPLVQPGLRGIGLQVGKRATAIGYADMFDTDVTHGGNDAVLGDFNFSPSVSIGQVLERFPENSINKKVRTPGPCFSASLKLPPGMSGSPIFDDECMYVHGVVSSGLEDQDGIADLGFGSMIEKSFNLPIQHLENATLQTLLRSDESGMLRLNIPDA